MSCNGANLVENDVRATLEDEIFVVKNINESTWSGNDNLQSTTYNDSIDVMPLMH